MASILDGIDLDYKAIKPKATAGDVAKQVGASAIEGIGYGFQAGGELVAAGVNKVAGTDLRAVNPLQAPVDSIRNTISAGGQVAMRDTPSGDLFKPDTWKMPESGSGYAMTLAQGLGSAASTVLPVAGVLGKGKTAAMAVGAVSGGAQAGGAAASDTRKEFADTYQNMNDEQLQQELPAYQELRAQGMDEAKARSTLVNRGALYSTVGAGTLGTLSGIAGGALMSRFVGGQGLPAVMGGAINNRAGQAAAGLVTGAVGEGTQEVVENMSATGARNLAYGRPVGADITEDTFADFAAGALTGGAVSGGMGALSKPQAGPDVQPMPTEDNPAPAPVERPDPSAGALSRAAAQLPAPEPVLALPAPEQSVYVDSNGVAQDVGPVRNVDGTMQPAAQGLPPVSAGLRNNPGLDQPVASGERPNTVPAEEQRRIDRLDVPQREQERADRLAAAFVDKVNIEAANAIAERRAANLPEPQHTIPPGLDLADKQGHGRWHAEVYRNGVEGLVSQLTVGGDVAYVRDEHDRIVSRTASINPMWWQDMDTSVKPGSVEKAKAIVQKALKGEKLGPKQARFIATMLDMVDDLRVDPQQAEQNRAILEEIEWAAGGEAARNQSDYQRGAGRGHEVTPQDDAELYAYLDGQVEPFSLNDLTPEDIESIKRELILLDDTTEATRRAGDINDGDSNGIISRAIETGREVPAQQGLPRGQRDNQEDGAAVPAGDSELLTSYTEEELAERERARLEAEQAANAEQTRQSQRTQADAERDAFSLTGSDRIADVAAAAGQNDLLAAPTRRHVPIMAPVSVAKGEPASKERNRAERIEKLQQEGREVASEMFADYADAVSRSASLNAARDGYIYHVRQVGFGVGDGGNYAVLRSPAISEYTPGSEVDAFEVGQRWHTPGGQIITVDSVESSAREGMTREQARRRERATFIVQGRKETYPLTGMDSYLLLSGVAEQAEAAASQQQGQRAQADADRNDFSLTGSDRIADVGAAAGQNDLLAPPPATVAADAGAAEQTQAAPTTDAAEDPWRAAMNEALQSVPASHPMRKKWESAAKHGLKAESDRDLTLEQVRAAAEQAAAAPTVVSAAPDADTKTKDADRFSGNKIFTADAVAAARARMKSKLGNLNSGIDPELMMDGMTIAGAYIESGVRDFAQYAAMMSEDFGDKIKPYLLSFWEAARNYPGVDKDGMTSAEESARLHSELLTPAVKESASEAVGTVAAKPKRTRKTGSKGDMVLTQDWGVSHIDGYGDSADREIGNDTKDAFLKETRRYLNAVADELRAYGYEPHLDRKGKAEKPVGVNEAGPAVSGDVSLVMRNEDNGNNVYITIGDSALAGTVPSTPSGIAIMYRVGPGADRYAAKAGNTWAPVDLSAKELATLVSSKARPAHNEARNEQPTDGAANQGGAQEVRGGRGSAQPGSAQGDSGSLGTGQPADGGATVQAEDSGRPGIREPGADVAAGEAVPGGRNAGDGRTRAGGAGSSNAGTGNAGAAGAENVAGSRSGDIADAVKAAGLLLGGTPTDRKFRVSLPGYEYANAILTRDGDQWVMTSRGLDSAKTGTLAEALAAAKAHMESARGAPPAPVTSPAATSVQAQDLHIDNPLEIVGGTPVQRFNRNKQSLELLQTLEEEGRQANPDEQKILAGYIGWGSFGQELFQGTWERPVYKDEGIWKERGEWLRDTLGESAWKSAQRSITNAHYTDPPTVMAMWDMVRRMGFTGGKVLEPSLGTGNFFSMMPADIKARSQLTGIELDETTGAIAKQLFPKSNIRVMGYEKSQTPDGFYDLVIGNWPFENTPIADRRYNKLNPMLHDYFFLKTLDQVRPGGIVIGITSAGSMDKQNTMIRRELARGAELLASIRLPSGAFAEYAGTKVVTDIVILRKRPERLVAVPKEATWVETGEFQTRSGNKVRVNQYYLNNPQSIIGELDFGHGTTTFRAGMIVHRPDNMDERLKQAVELVPENALLPRVQTDLTTYYANETGERHGALSLVNDRLMIAMGDQLVTAGDRLKYALKDATKTAAREKQLRDAVELRKLHSALVDAERRNDDAEPARRALSKGYKAFTKAHGRLRESFALSYLERIEDPFFAELAALENDDGTPAGVMRHSTTRSRRSIDNPSVRDAYVLARNQSINPSIEEVAKLAGKSVEAVRTELLGSGAVFEAPNGDIVPSDIYLSGNVREKLREAQAGLAEGNAAMQANIDALQEVMPEDVPYFNIETKLGATWVSPEAYKQYIAHMLSRTDTKGIDVSFQSGRWKVRLDPRLNDLPEADANYGTIYYTFSRLVQAAMSNQVLRLKSKDSEGNEFYDAEKSEEVNSRLAKIREDFGTWLWSDPERRSDMEREYNEARNAWATPTYDGSFLTFEGMALSLGDGDFNLRQHQVNAIWRAIVNRRSLNAHEVGTGKTFTMGGIAVESRRYGIAKKPVILAHNANSATVAKEIRMMYPSARVLYIDNLEPKNRDVRLRQIANDDWDAIVIPHSLIDRLSLREETLMQMAADDIAALEAEFYDAASDDGVDVSEIDLDDDEDLKKIRSVTAKELAKARKRIIESIKKQSQQSSREGAVAFEDLGIDMILVDEAHEFKKPPIVTRMQMKGLNTQVSGRSIALQFLTRYVRQMNNGGNVHTFTGTPITNTITEIYHQMRYVMESEMEQASVSDWDGWFGSFATEVQDVELSAAGDYEMVTRLAGFVNVPELRQMVGQYMDTVFAEDMPEMQPRKTKGGKQMGDELTEAERAELLNGRTEGAKDRPYKKVINATADMTLQQQSVFRELQGYAQDWRNASGKERRELMRTGDPRSPIVTEGLATKASFDVRLLDGSLAGMEGQTNDDPNSKASRAVSNVLEVYNSHSLAGQVIFAEMGFSKSIRRTRTIDGEKHSETVKAFSTIHDIVERLVQGGIPRAEIAIVDGKVKKEKRREIAEAMNEGTIRVVIGSTDTLGVGVNMQRNLRAMHHLDAPYMPGELEQRNGRGQRQGNQWNTVLEYRYMTDRLDGRRWQILAVKQRFITAFMKANNTTRVIEGEAAADEQSDILESFSEAAGDPRVLQRVKLQKKLESLQRKERMYTQGIADMRRQIRHSEKEVSELEAQIRDTDTEAVSNLLQAQRDNFTATIDGNTYDTRKDAIAALEDYLTDNVRMGDKKRRIGTYGGNLLLAEWLGMSDTPTTLVKVGNEEFYGKGIAGVEAHMRNLPKRVESMQQRREAAAATVENMRNAMQQPFAQAADLERVGKQLSDLEQDLSMNPVPPPAWLRQGAPIDSEVYRNKKPYIVTGHRYSAEGWFVVAEDDKGSTLIPYMEATDNVGMPLYDEREFEAPVVMTKDNAKGLTEADKVPDADAPKFSRKKPQLGGATRVRRFLSRRDVEQIAIRKMGKDTVARRFRFVDYAELPAQIKKAATDQGAKPEEVRAVHWRGMTYMVNGRFSSEADAARAMFHEHYVHFGLRAKYGKGLRMQLGKLLSGVGGLKGVRELSVKQGIDLSDYAKGLMRSPGVSREDASIVLMEELMAHMGETTGTLRRIVEEFVGMVRAWLRNNGHAELATLGVTDLAYELRGARQAAIAAAKSGRAGAPRFRRQPERPTPSVQPARPVNTKAFRDWFKNSKIVDEQGAPLVVYHGTRGDFDAFDTQRAGATDEGWYGRGIYTTAAPELASAYAGNKDGSNVLPLYVTLQNPYYWPKGRPAAIGAEAAAALTEELQAQGYDGVVVSNDFNDTPLEQKFAEIVVFQPSQVKSASGNRGTYDPDNDDIRFSLGTRGEAMTDEALRKLGLKPEAAQSLKDKIAAMTTGDLRNLLRDWGKRAEEGIFDGLNGIKKAEQAVGVTDPNQQGYVSARLATGLADVMHAVMHFGAPEWQDGIIGARDNTRGLLDILGDLGQDNLTDWLGWLGGKRAQMLKSQGRENNLSDPEIAELLELGQGKEALFERVYREYAKINEAVLDVAQEAGLLTADNRAKWATEYYVPFYRVTEEGLFLAPRGKKGLSHQTAGIKALKGGKVPTNDLLENILTNWTKRIDASLKNKALIEVVDNLKGSEYLTDESIRYTQAIIPRSEIAKRIRKDRKTLAAVSDLLGMPEGSTAIKVAGELMKPENEGFEKIWAVTAPTDPDIIRVQRDGGNEYYKVNDESLLRGLKHIEGSVFNDPITRIGRAFKRLLTTGVTASPDFILRNFIRDAAHAWVINKDGFTLGKDSMKGLREAFAEDSDYRDMMFAGSSFQGGYVHGSDPEAAAQIIRRALEKKGMSQAARDRHMASLVTSPAQMAGLLSQGWQKYRGVGDKIENANRLATYKTAIAAGKSKRQAAYEAKDLMDYSLRGNFAAAQWFTDVVPFLNARLQGLYKLGRAAKGDTSLIAKEVAIKGGYLAAFSLMLAAMNSDDERYKALPEWDKDMHWHVFLGDEHFRIPKPFELGIVFGTIPERMLHAMTGNQTGEQLTGAVARGFFETLAFNPVPQFYQPIREVQANRDFFRDRPIEGMADEGKLAEARYDHRTSALGKAIGQVTGPIAGLSPKQVDHLIQGYTGTLGGYVLSMSTLIADMGTPGEAPDRRISDLPVAKVLYSGSDPRSTQYHTDFYDMLGEADQIYRTVRSYREEGRMEAAAELMAKEGDKLKHRRALGMARQQFGAVRKRMTAIYRDPNMGGEEKRRQLNELQERSNAIAERMVRMAKADF